MGLSIYALGEIPSTINSNVIVIGHYPLPKGVQVNGSVLHIQEWDVKAPEKFADEFKQAGAIVLTSNRLPSWLILASFVTNQQIPRSVEQMISHEKSRWTQWEYRPIPTRTDQLAFPRDGFMIERRDSGPTALYITETTSTEKRLSSAVLFLQRYSVNAFALHHHAVIAEMLNYEERHRTIRQQLARSVEAGMRLNVASIAMLSPEWAGNFPHVTLVGLLLSHGEWLSMDALTQETIPEDTSGLAVVVSNNPASVFLAYRVAPRVLRLSKKWVTYAKIGADSTITQEERAALSSIAKAKVSSISLWNGRVKNAKITVSEIVSRLLVSQKSNRTPDP